MDLSVARRGLGPCLTLLTLLIGGCDRSADRAGADVSERAIGPLPTDTLKAALEDYDAKRISADSAAAIIAGYQQRTGRAVNMAMDAALLAALQRLDKRRVP